MRGSARSVVLCICASIALAACGPTIDPYCSDYDDLTGRGVALCRSVTEQPVCDEEGDTARFERDADSVVRLVGGRAAICDEAREVVCPEDIGTPYCLPELDD
jgi:hypothetical protein